MEVFKFKVPHYKGIVRKHNYWIVGIIIFLIALMFTANTGILSFILSLEMFVIMFDACRVDGFERAIAIFQTNIEEGLVRYMVQRHADKVSEEPCRCEHCAPKWQGMSPKCAHGVPEEVHCSACEEAIKKACTTEEGIPPTKVHEQPAGIAVIDDEPAPTPEYELLRERQRLSNKLYRDRKRDRELPEERTWRGYSTRLPKEYRLGFLANCFGAGRNLDDILSDDNVAQIVHRAFDWSLTPEGDKYWQDLYRNLRKNDTMGASAE